jgi:hypothetical protein
MGQNQSFPESQSTSINQETARQEMVRQEMVRQEMVRQEMARRMFVKKAKDDMFQESNINAIIAKRIAAVREEVTKEMNIKIELAKSLALQEAVAKVAVVREDANREIAAKILEAENNCKIQLEALRQQQVQQPADNNYLCQGWAENGECYKSPDYMLSNCKNACNEIQQQQQAREQEAERQRQQQAREQEAERQRQQQAREQEAERQRQAQQQAREQEAERQRQAQAREQEAARQRQTQLNEIINKKNILTNKIDYAKTQLNKINNDPFSRFKPLGLMEEYNLMNQIKNLEKDIEELDKIIRNLKY